MNSSLQTYLDKIRRVDGKTIFFVAGTEKSGTTWLQMLLDHHPQARCRGEGQIATKLWPELRRALDDYSAFVSGLNQNVFSEIEHFPPFREESIRAIQAFAAMLLLSEYGDDASLLAVGEKTPGHLRTLQRLRTLFPNARFVFICRDGRDIAVSGWYHLKRQYGAEKAEPLPAYAKRIASIWRQDYERAMAFSAGNPGACVHLRYEDLHQNPAPELVRVFDFLGLDSSIDIVEDCLAACNFGALAGGRERGQESLESHFRKGIVGDWRNHFDADTRAMFDAEAGDLLAKLGYTREIDVPAAVTATPAEDTARAAAKGPSDNAVDATLTSSPDLLQLARQRSNDRDWHGASEVLRTAIAAGQQGFESWYLLGQSLRALKDFTGAADAYLKAEASDPLRQDGVFMAAVALKEANQPDAAIAAYQRLLDAWPNFANGWSLYGVLLKELGRFREAIEALRASLAICEDIPTHNLLVIALEESGTRDLAIEEGVRLLAHKDKIACDAFAKSSCTLRVPDPQPRAFDYLQPARNIISFSLWGQDPVYVHGAIVNARLAANMYYGWTTRFYCDSSVPADALEELRYNGAQVVMVDDPRLLPVRHLWRFLVSDDPEVDWFVCRDTDSRVNAQELLAVEEWIRSGKAFHVMRDHIYHMELILAGMWGGVAGVLPNVREAILREDVYSRNRFGDQAFLMQFVWPLIKDHVLIHDSHYRVHGSKDFPEAYRLPRPIHVGGAIKNMGPWRRPH